MPDSCSLLDYLDGQALTSSYEGGADWSSCFGDERSFTVRDVPMCALR
jgi:hypothetical protein